MRTRKTRRTDSPPTLTASPAVAPYGRGWLRSNRVRVTPLERCWGIGQANGSSPTPSPREKKGDATVFRQLASLSVEPPARRRWCQCARSTLSVTVS